MSIPFIPFAIPDITEAEIDAVVAAMRSGWLTTGPNAAAFEEEFAAYLGGDVNAVAVNSATAGLHLAVEAIGLGPGDEVLVPTWTFTATAEVVRYVGAKPVLVDVDPQTLNMDFDMASSLITSRTRAIMPVHFAGLPIPGSTIREFASRHSLAVIEDAAHAFPVRDESRLVGAGDSEATVFSFYATKTITTGEGGMLVTRSDDIARRARVMRLHGISRDVFDRYTSTKPSWEYSIIAAGYKYNMPDTAAAMGRVQLSRAESLRQRRERIAGRYDDALDGLPAKLPPKPKYPRGHAHHLYFIRLTDQSPVGRNEFIEKMAAVGVGTSVHFIPLHLHPYWSAGLGVGAKDLPVASETYKTVVSLPIYPSMTDSDVDRVAAAVRGILNK
ncbi:DegT/DnrJ/EryC1/StrS aminotransferase family protein [Tessaracoccus sp. ZS01]|uniref:DegT/DnrJ/EryC1/StrS family aminotransferase n=1 Tax=Tessaracoccus sp. ZS01 TaxID=1906324 RepID=UPI00096E53C6|nr:DegT/DnrJ/EryC1/StrS aminotransferase family protein [Tessaracoccus sp. ZS01]MCG6568073.1 DegT/DnrJ/EryC1/StrS aminotransferase family protein [Tessaracoccus sp. ZS01]OMG54152.1 UDP-4-amino-4,6-dideoxy-N-acetyl-beta-L-altrosamine transaminase [Tessaracoccus sp. ZS01]